MKKPTNQQGLILPRLLLLIASGVAILGYLYLGQNQSQRLITQLTRVKNQLQDQVKKVVPKQPPATKTAVLPTSSALISITKDSFTPSTITVATGQQVTWVNQDQSNHQILSKELELDSEDLQPNDSFTFTFEKTGTYAITDKLNPLRFKGMVIVK